MLRTNDRQVSQTLSKYLQTSLLHLCIHHVCIAYWFGQATLVHVLIACTPLPASTRMVHGPWSAGHSVAVVAGVGGVVSTVGMVVVMAVAANESQES